jgi:formylglycine-generating enzyme required for sulfatase activity
MKTSRLFLFASILVLITLACNAPIISRFMMDTTQPDGESESSDEDISSSTDTDRLIPHNTDGAEVTFIPGDTYQMGSPTTDELADEDEIPQHQVSVDEFYIYTYEVTNQMYAACEEAGFCMPPQTLEEGPTSHYEDPAYAEFPVVGVDWVMARDYCTWAGVRLPTEAEWELVSRGPESLYYPWGEEEPTCDYVNMGGCYIPPDTQEVGYYLMGNSPYEVWDMSGNVWEWVHDWYAEDYYSISPENNPLGPPEPEDPDNHLRVIRGGGLNSSPDKMRSASRMGLNPYRVFIDVGFRCVVGEPLLLPDDYDPGHDRHERVPPDSADGGDSADDPDGDGVHAWASGTTGPCLIEGGNITLVFNAGATSTVLNVFTFFEGAIWDMHCDYDPVTELATCIGPPPPDYYTIPPPTFPMDVCVAIDEEPGTICIPDLLVWKPVDCGDRLEPLTVRMRPGCIDPSTPAVVLAIDPPDAPFSHAATDTMPLICDPLPEDGFYLCHTLTGSPGDMIDIHVSFTDGGTFTSTVEVPDCSVPFWIDHFCEEVAGAGNIPHLVLHYPPGGPAFVGAAAQHLPDPAVDLDCVVTAPGTAVCTGLPGVTGDMLGIVAVFDDGSTLLDTYPHPLCLEAEGLIPPWDLLLSCIPHDDGTAEYRASIDTNMAGWDFIPDSWTLTGVPEPKNCTLENPALNIWGCSFPIGVYTDLEFCAEWVGGPGLHCESYAIGAILPADCTPPPEDDDGGGDHETGWCIPAPPNPGCGANPCQTTCPQPGACIPCTLP